MIYYDIRWRKTISIQTNCLKKMCTDNKCNKKYYCVTKHSLATVML